MTQRGKFTAAAGDPLRRNIFPLPVACAQDALSRIVGRRAGIRRHCFDHSAADRSAVRRAFGMGVHGDGARPAGPHRACEIVRDYWQNARRVGRFRAMVGADRCKRGSSRIRRRPQRSSADAAADVLGASLDAAAPSGVEILFEPDPSAGTGNSPTTPGCRKFPGRSQSSRGTTRSPSDLRMAEKWPVNGQKMLQDGDVVRIEYGGRQDRSAGHSPAGAGGQSGHGLSGVWPGPRRASDAGGREAARLQRICPAHQRCAVVGRGRDTHADQRVSSAGRNAESSRHVDSTPACRASSHG